MTAFDLSKVRVRPYAPRDRTDVIAAEADLQEYERKLHDTRIPGDEAAEPIFRLLESLINANDGEIFVAEDDGGFLGYAAGFVLRDENPAETEDSNICGYINDVYVVPHRRGRGVASLLLQAVEDFLRTKGMVRLRINTLVANEFGQARLWQAGLRALRSHDGKAAEAAIEPVGPFRMSHSNLLPLRKQGSRRCSVRRDERKIGTRSRGGRGEGEPNARILRS